ncbi:shikimate dehydrogenase family protein [Zobellia galactanivorans]|uniref:Shikimate dehydrogenase n=1 Tax=Zobellia galactanivorans (strain DSM 12802 / CCUG 47099 / CIP 106680 / NCIMB 13871 / Dsij) TaxID=63186 RepID=F6I9U2_ZOBGA|nr:shikimate dehydrogenase [Zobellia galactanivorans]CAZ97806.1 Shikimate dehydrogenase [Zobellia galactanivorans]CBM41463.1 Shikimate dehydrogenase [Zobellia galactanivorans]
MKRTRFGLVGKNISYSFSRGYFTKKFASLGLNDHSYENFDFQAIEEITDVLKNNKDINGMNVTIPYKQEIMPFLTELDPEAEKIGAVNTIQFNKNGLKGFNTDAYGFKHAMSPFLKPHHTKALILGTGGASKAVAYVLGELCISYLFVSRSEGKNKISYDQVTEEVLKEHTVLVNCTPLGTHPNIEERPTLPYEFISDRHFLFDLIYNPEKSAFLTAGEAQGAQISNGLRMLELQADRSWQIWQER